MNLVKQDYWDKSYDNVILDIAPDYDEVRQWIEHYFNFGSGSCLEIGCYPGRYLAIFGELGFELNGIDMTPRVVTHLPEWLKNRNYKVGSFKQIDFMDSNYQQKFDVVTSFGFIEHFSNWKDVLSKQASLVKDGGYLLVATPNFRGSIQRLLHSILDKENFNRHNTSAMDTKEWEKVVAELNFRTLFSGTFGKFDFWVDNEKRTASQLFLLQILNTFMPILKLLPKNKASYAPYCGLVAKKN